MPKGSILKMTMDYINFQRGKVKIKAIIGEKTKDGNVFISMHYTETNQLIYSSFDKYSKQPAFKYAAVNLIPIKE